MIVFSWELTEQEVGQRLDVAITAHCGGEARRVSVAEAIAQGRVLVDDQLVTKSSFRPRLGAKISGSIPPEPVQTRALAEPMDLKILYQDEHLLVVVKPKGMVTHPCMTQQSGTLLQGIFYHFPENMALPQGGLIQRLDKDTSGVMVVALSILAHQRLLQMMQRRQIQRQYQALVWGRPEDSLTLEWPLTRHPKDPRKRAICAVGGKPARTDVRVLAYGRWGSHVECTLSTGRTHQIRVHMQACGYPVCGDPLYGLKHPPLAAPEGFKGQALHARTLSFMHPMTKEKLSFHVEPPQGWSQWLELLEMV